ncbi:MAG: hypothetical protein Q9199_001754 [Rusavskia elegans]
MIESVLDTTFVLCPGDYGPWRLLWMRVAENFKRHDTVACGSFDTDFNAAISENLYGANNGVSAGTCGTCWRLTVTRDMNGEPLSGTNSVVVKVNDLCPFKGNEDYCMPVGSKELNKYKMQAHFDLCADAKAAATMFGSSNTTLATGSAKRVDCSERIKGAKDSV